MTGGGRVVLGLGARSSVPQEELGAAIDAALDLAGLRPADVAGLATLDRRAAEQGVRSAADCRGWRVVAFAAVELAEVAVPHSSGTVLESVGTASVAEAAALLAAGSGAVLVLPKRVFPRATVAIARGCPDEASPA